MMSIFCTFIEVLYAFCMGIARVFAPKTQATSREERRWEKAHPIHGSTAVNLFAAAVILSVTLLPVMLTTGGNMSAIGLIAATRVKKPYSFKPQRNYYPEFRAKWRYLRMEPNGYVHEV